MVSQNQDNLQKAVFIFPIEAIIYRYSIIVSWPISYEIFVVEAKRSCLSFFRF